MNKCKSISLGDGVRVPYPNPTSPGASASGRANKSSGTGPENRLGSAMHALGLRYRRNLSVDVGRRIRPDFVFTRKRVAVFLDGCFWHGCPLHSSTPKANSEYWVPKLRRNQERDAERSEALLSAGWTVIRIWGHEDAVAVAEAVQFALQRLSD